MIKITVDSSGIVLSQSDERINILDQTIQFVQSIEETVYVDVQLKEHESLKLSYVFESNTTCRLVERKTLNTQSVFHKDITVLDGAHIKMFLENLTKQSENVECIENVSIKKDASMSVGYAELEEANYKGEYLYTLDGEGASAKVRMAALSNNDMRKNYKVSIEHCAKYTSGQMDNYGVVKNNGKLYIDGIGTIQRGYSGSSSHQTNKIIVFDEGCIAQANPYLFIDEYDVKASHAAAVGRMDDEHLYYLQSRGLTKHQSMQLITYGYLMPVVEVVEDEDLKQHFEDVLLKAGA